MKNHKICENHGAKFFNPRDSTISQSCIISFKRPKCANLGANEYKTVGNRAVKLNLRCIFSFSSAVYMLVFAAMRVWQERSEVAKIWEDRFNVAGLWSLFGCFISSTVELLLGISTFTGR